MAVSDAGTIVAANRRLHEDLGHPVGELVGHRLDRVLAPAARIFYFAQMRPALELGRAVEEVYLTVRTRDGASLPVVANARRERREFGAFTIFALLPMQRRAEFEQRMIGARRTAEELAQTHAELLERREAELRENTALADRLRELATRLEADHAETARATARTLHESVAQDIAAIRLGVDSLRRTAEGRRSDAHLEALEQLASQALAQVRDLSYDLYPAVLEHAALPAALRAAARDAAREFGLEVDVVVSGEVPPLEREPALVLYRFVEEALRNAVRHGLASRADVRIACTGGSLEVSVTDDGTAGAVPDADATTGLGLLAARERLRRLGGELATVAAVPQGLRVAAVVPVSATAARNGTVA
jgi:signal transduction histidine kinase